MNWEKKILACLLSGFVYLPALAQPRFEKEITLNKENGLPVNDVRSMVKGDDGFIWIATSAGLCRFDGRLVKTFVQSADLRHSILDNTVNCVMSEKNKLWIGTGQGISLLNT